MTYAEYELGYYMGDSEDYSGPLEDPETQAMLEHLIEYETEMFKLECRRRYSGCTYRQLRSLLINLHGEYWKNAL